MHPWGDIGTAHEVALPRPTGVPSPPSAGRAGVDRRHHALACNGSDVACGCGRCSSCARAYSSLRLLLSRLQRRCVSLTLSHASGSPPRDTGMISSTSALIGCGERSDLSTGCPQIAHVSYAASTRCLSCRRRCPFALRGLARPMIRSPDTFTAPDSPHRPRPYLALSYTRRAILVTLAVTVRSVNRAAQQQDVRERVHGVPVFVLAEWCEAAAFAPLGDGVAFDGDAARVQESA